MYFTRAVQNCSILQCVFRRIIISNDLRLSNLHSKSLICSSRIVEEDTSCNWITKRSGSLGPTALVNLRLIRNMSSEAGCSKNPSNTNRLILERSPYLLQHATNPVDWYPWGQEAFDKAKAENKLIFLYIVLHAGTKKGFIEGASLIFKSKKGIRDYYDEMNANSFENWMKNSLLPFLEEPSIIIMDNASYHSRQLDKAPTKLSTKAVMQIWLREENVNYPDTATKEVSWELITKTSRPIIKSFVTDSLIQEVGHEVLRLPPYHCQFNAIEMVWSQAKRFLDNEVLTNKDVLVRYNVSSGNIISNTLIRL